MLYLVAMYDAGTQDWVDLKIVKNLNIARRNFQSSLMISLEKKEGLMYTNPSDFSLWEIAQIDDMQGLSVYPVMHNCIAGEEPEEMPDYFKMNCNIFDYETLNFAYVHESERLKNGSL